MKKWSILLAILALDQVTKSMAAAGIILFNTSFLSFSYVENTGSLFGILQGANQYLVWISFIFIGLIMYYYYSLPEKDRIPLTIISAGILGNLIDRMVLGFVIDFIDLHWWPVFNVADSAIVMGIAWLLWNEFRAEAQHKQKAA